MARETTRRRQQPLQQIESALCRVHSGDCGDCFVCGEYIGDTRHAIDPSSTSYVNCLDNSPAGIANQFSPSWRRTGVG